MEGVVAEVVNDGNFVLALGAVSVGQVQVVNFQDSTVVENAITVAYSMANFDSNQNALQTVTYTGDGADNLWFTADDQVSIIALGVINATTNRLDFLYTYDAAGPEGSFFTADDEMLSISAFDYTGSATAFWQ